MFWRRLQDLLSTGLMRFALALANLLVVLIVVGLVWKSWPILSLKTLPELLLGTAWQPLRGNFGFLPFIVGTLEVTAIAMLLAGPISLLTAIYLSEYAPYRLARVVRPVIDLLAGIPSVIFGFWGVLVVVPAVRSLAQAVGVRSTGYSLLSGSIVLAIMVFPVIISVAVEVLRSVPTEAREAALALGATRWETVKHVLLRSALRGILAAIVLGFTRALGETMAVLMVVGTVVKIPRSIFDPAYPLPALIANNYGEMMSVPLYDSALLLAALILLVVVAGFNLVARLTLRGIERGWRA